MDSIVKYSCEDIAGVEISCVIAKGEPWFKAKEIAEALGYSDTKQAVKMNVDEEDKTQYKNLDVTSHGGKNTPLGGRVSNAAFVRSVFAHSSKRQSRSNRVQKNRMSSGSL